MEIQEFLTIHNKFFFGFLLLGSLISGLKFIKNKRKHYLNLGKKNNLIAFIKNLHKTFAIWSIPFIMLFSVTAIWYFTERANLFSIADFIEDKEIENVSVSSNHPGSNGQWQVCITADRPPISGSGSNRPQSPCEVRMQNNNGDSPRITNPNTRTIKKPVQEEKPIETKPTRTKPTRTSPSRKTPSQRETGGSVRTKPKEEKEPTRERNSSRSIEKNTEEKTKAPSRRSPSRSTGGGL